MRIVVSGTHASGKSTLISDFAVRHSEFIVLPDPFESIDETSDTPGASMFAAQLRASADRLLAAPPGAHLIAERGPIDFLAYLFAMADLSGAELDRAYIARAIERTTAAMTRTDVLVVLPLAADDPISVSDEEHLELRSAMNDRLLDLIDDPGVVGEHLLITEISGTPDERLAALEEFTGWAGDGR